MNALTALDVSNITFSTVRRNASGGKTIYMNSKDSGRLELVLPAMRVPFGLSAYTDKNTGNISYSLNMSLDDPSVLEKLKSIETLVLDHVEKNSIEILGKAYSRDILRDVLFKSFIQYGKEPEKYAPTLKVKVYTKKPTGFSARAFDDQKREVSMEDVKKGSTVKALIDLNQVWAVDNKFGVTIVLKQVRLTGAADLTECVLGDDCDEEETEI